MKQQIQALLIAIQFLTTLPLPLKPQYTDSNWQHSVRYYPLVGLLIGLLLAFFTLLLHNLPVMLNAALTLALWVILTGALHHDGLADMADALAGGHADRQRALEIMKDPRSGPIAVITLITVSLIQYASLVAMLPLNTVLPILVIIPLISRLYLLPLIKFTPYVRQQGMGATLSDGLGAGLLYLLLLTGCIVVVLVTGVVGVYLLVIQFLFLLIYRWFTIIKFAGITGDIAGAFIPLSETLSMVTLVTVITSNISP